MHWLDSCKTLELKLKLKLNLSFGQFNNPTRKGVKNPNG